MKHIEQWQITRLVDKIKSYPGIQLKLLKQMHTEFYNVTLHMRTTAPMKPDEIEYFVRANQLKACVGYRSEDSYIMFAYSDTLPQHALHSIVTRIVGDEPNYAVEGLWQPNL